MKHKFTKILFIGLVAIVVSMLFSMLLQDVPTVDVVSASDEPIVEEQMTTKLQSQDFESEEEVALWKFDSATVSRSTQTIVEIDKSTYHSGSSSLHAYKDSLLEKSWLENTSTTYTISDDRNLLYEVSCWVKSANSSPTSILTVFFRSPNPADANKPLTNQGSYALLNTTSTPSGWTQLVFHAKINNKAQSGSAFWVAFEITQGTAEVWIDDISVREYNVNTGETDKNGATIYSSYPLNLGFNGKDETGKMDWSLATDSKTASLNQIEENSAMVGRLDAQSGYAYIEKKINVLQTGYSYKLFGHYSSNQDATVSVSLYDTKDVNVANYSTVLSKDKTYFETNLVEVQSATYAIIAIGFANANNASLTVKDVGLKELETTVQPTGWSGQWVWYESTPGQTCLNESRYFRYTFDLPAKAVYAPFQISCDDIYTVYVNGYNMVDILSRMTDKNYETNHYNVVESYMIEEFLQVGKNVIAIEGKNGTSTAALLFDSKTTLVDETVVTLVSKANDTSLLSTKIDDSTSHLFNTTEVVFNSESDQKTYTCQTPAWAMPNFDVNADEDVEWVTCAHMGDPPCSPWGAVYYDYSLYATNELEFVSISTPKDVKAGDTIKIDATIKIKEAIEMVFPLQTYIWKRNAINSITQLTMTLVGNNSNMLSWPVGEAFDVSFEVSIPKYLETGDYQLQLEESYLSLVNDFIDQKFLDFKVTGLSGQNDETVCTLEVINGQPTIVINGEACSPVMYCRPEQASSLPGCEETIINSGIQLYATRLESELESFWMEFDTYDFSSFDSAVYDIMAVNGDAKILLCISMFAPNWWMNLEKYPEHASELVVNNVRDGNDSTIPTVETLPGDSQGASFSSVKFREDSSKALKELLNHIKEQPYYNKLFGFQICAGKTYEWMIFNEVGVDSSVDYSEASKKGFEIYLRNKYGTRDALRSAWGDNTVSFETVEIPNTVERDPNGQGGCILLDPTKDQRIIDFNLYIMDEGANLLLHYAEIVKTITNDEKIVGAFNGYLWAEAGTDNHGKTHSSFNKLLNSDYLDFFVSPLGYNERYIGRATTYMPPIDSIIAHGKLYIAEVDHRTSLESSYSSDQDYGGGQGTSTGKTYTIEESVLQYRKELVQALMSGVGLWFFDLRGNWVGEEQHYQVIKEMKQEFDYSYTFDSEESTVKNEVAVIIGEETIAHTTYSAFNAIYHLLNYLYRYQRVGLNAMGAGYDVYSMGDLTDGVLTDDYKVYIFLSPIEITAEESTAIDNIVKTNGHTVVWVYGTGFSNGKSLDTANISALTGMNIVADYASQILNVEIGNNSYVSSIAGNRYGNSTMGVNPLLYVDDKTATTLGKYCEGSSVGKTGLAMKQMDGWTSIYSGAPNLSVELLRCILKQSGVHIYSENSNDVVYQRSNYVGIHSAFAEEKTINLDGYYAVYDVINQTWYSMNTNQIKYNHVANDTSLFRLSTPDKYRLTVSKTDGGEVSCGKVEELGWGQGIIITLTPNEGYEIGQVLIDGEQYVVENNRIVVTNMQNNQDVSVSFVKQAVAEDNLEYIYQYTEIDDGNILPVKIFLVLCCVGVIVFVLVKNINKLKEKNNDK